MAAIETELTHDTVQKPRFPFRIPRIAWAMCFARKVILPSIFGAASKSVPFSDRIRSHYRETRHGCPAKFRAMSKLC